MYVHTFIQWGKGTKQHTNIMSCCVCTGAFSAFIAAFSRAIPKVEFRVPVVKCSNGKRQQQKRRKRHFVNCKQCCCKRERILVLHGLQCCNAAMILATKLPVVLQSLQYVCGIVTYKYFNICSTVFNYVYVCTFVRVCDWAHLRFVTEMQQFFSLGHSNCIQYLYLYLHWQYLATDSKAHQNLVTY